jgi:hypothetical protein
LAGLPRKFLLRHLGDLPFCFCPLKSRLLMCNLRVSRERLARTPTKTEIRLRLRWPVQSVLALVLLASAACPAIANQDGPRPAFTSIPELSAGFQSLYAQNFSEARKTFNDWESQHPEEPLGEIAIAASYLFEELLRQGVLSSDFGCVSGLFHSVK